MRANLEAPTVFQRVGAYGKVSTCFRGPSTNVVSATVISVFFLLSVISYCTFLRLMSGFAEALTFQSLLHMSVLVCPVQSNSLHLMSGSAEVGLLSCFVRLSVLPRMAGSRLFAQVIE